ncbi:hypothetical protein ONZ45_g15313 [Pleurotus djamor]|nr:hypothetical protein ONZ45_g15313 [Pleurotus djamor]
MTRTATMVTRSRANAGLTGESPLTSAPPTDPRDAPVSDSEATPHPSADRRARSMSDVADRRVPSSEENPFRTKRVTIVENNNDSSSDDLPDTPSKGDKNQNKNKLPLKTAPALNPEQSVTVEKAANSLSQHQRDLIAKRQQALQEGSRAHETPVSLGEGPSQGKGKGVDPRNWGNLDFSDDDLDPEAQANAMRLWKTLQREQRNLGGRSGNRQETTEPDPSVQEQIRQLQKQNAELMELVKSLTAPESGPGTQTKKVRTVVPLTDPVSISHGIASELRNVRTPRNEETPHNQRDILPSNQIPRESYLGRAFNHARRRERAPSRSGGESTPGSDPSDSNDSDDTYSEVDSRSERSENSDARYRRHRRREYKKRRALIKPNPPDNYDGEADNQAFFKFMHEYSMYVEEGKLPRRQKVAKVGRFLTGKAYTFYMRQVAYDARRWTLDEFFTALFNYCFPADYVSKQRRRLQKLYQHEKKVKEYTSELIELFTIIGMTDERERVNKLWNGLRFDIQKDLWKDRLNPETASWDKVVEAAEIIEISLSIGASQHSRDHQKKGGNNKGNHKPSGSGSSKPDHGKGKPSNHGQGGGFHSNQSRAGSSRFRDHKRSSNQKPERPRLSDAEIERLKSERRCFTCKEVGHMSRQCPKAHNVASSSSRGPPGLPSHSIGVEIVEDTEELREAVDCDDTVDYVDVGFMGFDIPLEDIPEEDDAYTSEWSEEYRPIGDVLSEACERILQQYAWHDFPGDEGLEPLRDLYQGRRFTAMQISDEQIVIHDNRSFDRYEYLDRELLLTPEFRLVEWYAFQMAERHFLDESAAHEFIGTEPVGDILADFMRRTLRDNAPHFGDIPMLSDEEIIHPERYEISWVDDRDAYQIFDTRTGFVGTLDTAWLITHGFDLVAWYQGSLIEYYEFIGICEGILDNGGPYATDVVFGDHQVIEGQFSIDWSVPNQSYMISDTVCAIACLIEPELIHNPHFDLRNWYLRRTTELFDFRLEMDEEWVLEFLRMAESGFSPRQIETILQIMEFFEDTGAETISVEVGLDGVVSLEEVPASAGDSGVGSEDGSEPGPDDDDELDTIGTLQLLGLEVERGTYPALQRNAAMAKDPTRLVPRPLVVNVKVNGHPARALIDSGSLGDFMSTNLATQLGLKMVQLSKPLPVQLAVQGSRSKVNFGCRAKLEYHTISEERYFDIINVSNYDLILGTPFLFQHQVTMSVNPPKVTIGSKTSTPIKGVGVAKLASQAIHVPSENELERVREELRRYAEPLCVSAEETPLPPLRAINHEIPLIDENKAYHWRPSRCPEPLRDQWNQKRANYIRTGRWKFTSAGNAIPMMLIYKPGTKLLRVVNDLRERNANTKKMSSPLPVIEAILRHVARARFFSLMDGQNAYEQIRIIPAHVSRTTVTTPDGNMQSLVMQQGDCNAPATYQALMNHLFAPYIGIFMYVYLDDIIIFSDTLEDHIKHVKIVIDILKKEKLYLAAHKLHFLCKELRVLGRVVDKEGIRMDPDKVDSVLKWKVPTNRTLLRGFLGAVGYLADDIARVRIPMGILSSLTGDTVPFRWEFTHQRAFEDIKKLVHQHRNVRRKPLDYSEDAPPIWVVTDGCATGIAGVVSQGKDWKTADVAAFFSAKLNPAQQNYPVHEIEMLAGVETMLRHRDILQGANFKWLTDHKGLIHLLNQKNLSGRQARWLEKISEFDFTPEYIPGTENVLSDALSRLYASDDKETKRSPSEYAYLDVDDDMPGLIAAPVSLETESEPRYNLRKNRRLTEKARALLEPEEAAPSPPESSNFVRKSLGKRKEGGTGKRKENQHSPMALDVVENSVDEMPSSADPGFGIPDQPPTEASSSLPPPPSLLDVIGNDEHGLDIPASLLSRYGEDKFFQAIIEDPRSHKNFEYNNGLLYLKTKDRTALCIPHIKVGGRNIREIIISEAHSLLAHLGASKTIAYLRDHVWWKDLVKDTQAFSSYPWEAIGVDFIGPLPESSDRDATYDSITVVIDLLTAMVHLVPSRTTYTARNIAELIFGEVYKLHGLPRRILNMSSAYHPESDGSTERANRTVTQMIRSCIHPSQRDWVSKLPAIEFAINLSRSESTGYSPFFLNSGRTPRPFIWDSNQAVEFPGVRVFAQKIRYAVMAAHDSILAARIKQTRDANRHRRPAPFVTDDLVYISTKNISFPKGLARKFVPKYIGPYKVIRDFKNETFELELSARLKQRGVHPSFHASLLRIHIPNDDRLFPGRHDSQLIDEDYRTESEWAVDAIVSHYGSKKDAVFQIRWTSGDLTWLPYHQVSRTFADYPLAPVHLPTTTLKSSVAL